VQRFTASMSLLSATSTFELGRSSPSSPYLQKCKRDFHAVWCSCARHKEKTWGRWRRV